MDVARLEVQARALLSKGIAPSTNRVYSSAQRIFLDFCTRLNLAPIPASEATLILFATELAQTRAHSTIRTYLAGVRHLHVTNGQGNPLSGTLRLELVLKGIHRIKPNQKQVRLPVTPNILSRIKGVLDSSPGYESSMIWAACCTGFFGFLRCGEFLLPDATTFDNTTHLAVSDISVDSHQNPTMIAIRIKRSKTDQFGEGATVYLGKTSAAICPVTAMLGYLAIRPEGQGPLFVTSNQKPVTKRQFMSKIQKVLGEAGIDASGYKGHSFRIGAATTAAACGLNEGLIKALGRWSSCAYQVYIKIPPRELANIAPILSNHVA